MIKQLTVWLKGTLVTEQADTYAYKAYLEILLNYFDNASNLKPKWMVQGDRLPLSP